MQRAIAYAALATELEAWRKRSHAELLSALDQPPKARMVNADGEELSLEVVVSWANAKQRAFKLVGTAYGPSHQRTERLEEALIVPIST